MTNTISVDNVTFRTDWIHQIQSGKLNGKPYCIVWFSIGSDSLHTFTGIAAETALQLLAGHPALKSG